MILAAANVNIIPDQGIWDTIFYKSWVQINIFGLLGPNGFKINLAGLIIVLIIGLAATAIIERLAGAKPGQNLLAVALLTMLGAYIFASDVKLPFELLLEGVPIVAAFLGAIVFGVFYVLIRKSTQSSQKAAASH